MAIVVDQVRDLSECLSDHFCIVTLVALFCHLHKDRDSGIGRVFAVILGSLLENLSILENNLELVLRGDDASFEEGLTSILEDVADLVQSHPDSQINDTLVIG